MAAFAQITPQSRSSSSIQTLRNEGKVKDIYISEKLMARSNSAASESSSSSHSKAKTMSYGHEVENSSPKEQSPMFASSTRSYGSIQGLTCSDRQSVASLLDDDNYTPPTPPHTTITPNDNDGGIYLSWTQHMLRQQGFRPSSYNPNEVSESDSDSTNSSLTDDEDSLTITPPHLPTSRSVPSREAICNIDIKKDENDKGWLAVAFCGFCFL